MASLPIFLVLIFIIFTSNNVKCKINECCVKNLKQNSRWYGYCEDGSSLNLLCNHNEKIQSEKFRENFRSMSEHELNNTYRKYCIFYEDNVVLHCVNKEADPIGYHFDFSIIFYISNIISIISATITVYLYFWLPNLQDVHGTCIFHLSICVGLKHTCITYYLMMRELFLPESFCLVETNIIILVILAAYSWSMILSYNTWKQIKGNQTINFIRRLNYYRSFGYGFPILCVVAAFVHHLHETFRYENANELMMPRCIAVLAFYLRYIFLSTVFVNTFFFLDSRWRLRKLYAASEANENNGSFLKKLKYKTYLNLKMSLIMNIPSAILIMLLLVLPPIFNSMMLLYTLLMSLIITISLEGTLIFLVAVVFRKRVIQGFINHGRNSCINFLRSRLPEKLRTMKDDEETESEQEAYSEDPEKEVHELP